MLPEFNVANPVRKCNLASQPAPRPAREILHCFSEGCYTVFDIEAVLILLGVVPRVLLRVDPHRVRRKHRLAAVARGRWRSLRGRLGAPHDRGAGLGARQSRPPRRRRRLPSQERLAPLAIPWRARDGWVRLAFSATEGARVRREAVVASYGSMLPDHEERVG